MPETTESRLYGDPKLLAALKDSLDDSVNWYATNGLIPQSIVTPIVVTILTTLALRLLG